jgi:outer membrane immunogenic protein
MPKFSAIAAAAFLASGSAFAQGAAVDWSGFYGGASVGYSTASVFDETFGTGTIHPGGAIGTVFAGYDYAFGSIVAGVEADVSVSGISGNDGDFLLPIKQDYSASVRGRLGVPVGSWMPYVTGGLALSKFTADHEGFGNPGDIASKTFTGYTVGAGVEKMLSGGLFGRADYAFSDYGRHDMPFYGGTDPHSIKISTHAFRLGIGMKW